MPYLTVLLLLTVALAGCSGSTVVNDDSGPPPTLAPTAAAAAPTAVSNDLPTATAAAPTAAATPAPGGVWERQAIGVFWDVAVPPGWSVDGAGSGEGYARLAGSLGGRFHAITLAFPIGIGAASLEEWVDGELGGQSGRRPTTVDGAPALLVLDTPPAEDAVAEHRAYLWRSGGANPRLITAAQLDGPADPAALEELLVRFLAEVRSRS